MNNKILILNCSPVNFSNKETGEVKEMCKITYGVFLEPTENFTGYFRSLCFVIWFKCS